MLKKIVKIFALIILSLLFLFTLARGRFVVGALATKEDILDVIFFWFAIMVMGIALFKNKNIKVFLLGFLPAFVFIGIFVPDINEDITMVIPTIILYLGLMVQMLILKKKYLFFIFLVFVPFFIDIADLGYECSSDEPMRHRRICEPCDSEIISIPKRECEKCSETRVFENGYSFFKKSNNKIRPLFTLGIMFDSPDLYANRTYCDDETEAWTSKSNCDQCPNREYVDGKCVLKESK